MNANAGRGCGCGAAATPPPADVLVLRTQRDLVRLAGLIPAYGGLRLDVPGMAADEAAGLVRVIERDYRECGCRAGARALIAGAAATLVAVIYWRLANDVVAPVHLLRAAGLALAATVAVKYGVVVRARVRLHRTLRATLPAG